MRILIEFDSCWKTSFLGDDTKKPIAKVSNKTNKPSNEGYMQKFVATSKSRGETPAPINLNTILGVLCRLIGDQRKLYQSKRSDNYYFADIEEKITWKCLQHDSINELMYLTNKSDSRCAQSSFLGVLDDNNPWFFSSYSALLWSILFLNQEQLIDFILSKKINTMNANECFPKNLIERVNKLTNTKSNEGAVIKTRNKLISENRVFIEKQRKKLNEYQKKIKNTPPKTATQESKTQVQLKNLVSKLKDAEMSLEILLKDKKLLEADSKLAEVIRFLSNKYPNDKKLGEEYCKNEIIYPMSLYAGALYIQAEYLLANKSDILFLKDTSGNVQIQGFSKWGFNGIRDWLNSMTGGRKKSVGTPVQVGKHSGKLEIEISVEKEKGREIIEMIENAGVSSFYLGKKGLAYVTKMRV